VGEVLTSKPSHRDDGHDSPRVRQRLASVTAVMLTLVVVAVVLVTKWPGQGPEPDGLVTSWLGNSDHGGAPGGASSEWVQQNVRGIAVRPDGTIFATSVYDEGGREVGVYRDGRVVGQLAETHGFGRTGGSAIALEGQDVLVAVAQTGEFTSAAPVGKQAYGVRVFDGTSYRPKAVLGGSGADRSTRFLSTTSPVTGIATTNNLWYVALARQNVIRVLNRSDGSLSRELHVPDPQNLVVDGRGGLWVASGNAVLYLTPGGAEGVRIPVLQPSALALGQAGALLIATDGPSQQVLVYDVTDGHTRRLQAIGVDGGMRSAPAGRAGPLRFDGIVGVGIDAPGAVYVAAGLGGTGTDLRKVVRDGIRWRQEWQLLALAFVDGADLDPQDPTLVYTARDKYRLDLNRPAGRQWTWISHTVDRSRFPADPRLTGEHRHVTPDVVRIQGRLLLFLTGMYQDRPGFYRFDGDVAVPSTAFSSAGWGWQVDDRGDVWNTDGTSLRHYSFLGLNTTGDPQYSTPQITTAPAGFQSLQRVHYDRRTDTMFLSGWTTSHPLPAGNDMEKLIGSEVWRINSWSTGNRTPVWSTAIPFSRIGTDIRTLYGQIGLTFVGDRFFTVESATSKVRSYSSAGGQQLSQWLPGTEVGSYAGVVDVPDGIKAAQRADGTYLVFVEEDSDAKVLMYTMRS